MARVIGFRELKEKLEAASSAGKSIATAGVVAGIRQMGNEVRHASPGRIGNEVGERLVKSDSRVVIGIVGLSVGKGARTTGAHGRFLTVGTKYITARRFVRQAFMRSIDSALAATNIAVKRSLERVARNK